MQGCETVNRSGSTGPGGDTGSNTGNNGNRGDNGQQNGPDGGTFAIAFARVKLAKALKSAVAVKVQTPGPGKVTVRARRGSKVVASGSAKACANGTASLKLKFNKAGRKALRKARSAKLTVQVIYAPVNGDALRGQTKLTLKR